MMWFDEEELNADGQETAACKICNNVWCFVYFTNLIDLFVDYLKPLF
jgi:hypothetical protein